MSVTPFFSAGETLGASFPVGTGRDWCVFVAAVGLAPVLVLRAVLGD